MDLTRHNPKYFAKLPLYRLIDEVLKGEEHIKAKGTTYLPMTSGLVSLKRMVINKQIQDVDMNDISCIYSDYLARAQFPSWAEEAALTMAGLISQVVPHVKLPEDFNYIIENATHDGFNLTELFRRACYLCSKHSKVTLVADVDDEGKAYISIYNAYSEYNWAERNVRGRKKELVMVGFKELEQDLTDPFNIAETVVHRAYVLNKDNIAQVWEDRSDGTEPKVITEFIGMENRPLTYLPVVRVFAVDNGEDSSNPPLLPIIRASLKAYSLSADLHSALHRSCHPQLYATGVDTSPVQDFMQRSGSKEGPLNRSKSLGYTGAGTTWLLPNGATVGYAESQGHGIKQVSAEISNQRTTSLEAGAKVMNVGVESGDARNARQQDQYASLYSIIKNVAQGIEQCLRYAYDMTSSSENKDLETSITYEVSSEFGKVAVDATFAAHLLSAAERKAISFSTYWTYLATGKAPERTFEQERKVMEGEKDIKLEPVVGMVQKPVAKDPLPKDAKPPE